MPTEQSTSLELDIRQRRILAEFGVPGFISALWAQPKSKSAATREAVATTSKQTQNTVATQAPVNNILAAQTTANDVVAQPATTSSANASIPTAQTDDARQASISPVNFTESVAAQTSLPVSGATTSHSNQSVVSSSPSSQATPVVDVELLQKDYYLTVDNQQLAYANGDVQAPWLFISEIPRSWKDTEQTINCRQLLDNMLAALKVSRQQGAFVIELYPSHSGEQQQFTHQWLKQIIKLLPCKIIVTMGRTASMTTLAELMPVGRLRGHTCYIHEIPLVPSYPPELLLLRPADKKPAWEDLCRARDILNNITT